MNFKKTEHRNNPQLGTWTTDLYIVQIRAAENPDFYWLTVTRHDGLPIHSWIDMQTIKNELIGPENEAVELYPAESRLVNEANSYHLWVLRDNKVRFSVGLRYRRVK